MCTPTGGAKAGAEETTPGANDENANYDANRLRFAGKTPAARKKIVLMATPEGSTSGTPQQGSAQRRVQFAGKTPGPGPRSLRMQDASPAMSLHSEPAGTPTARLGFASPAVSLHSEPAETPTAPAGADSPPAAASAAKSVTFGTPEVATCDDIDAVMLGSPVPLAATPFRDAAPPAPADGFSDDESSDDGEAEADAAALRQAAIAKDATADIVLENLSGESKWLAKGKVDTPPAKAAAPAPVKKRTWKKWMSTAFGRK